MKIEVRLFATLRKGRGKKVYIEEDEGLTPKDIIDQLKIDEKDVSILLVNGRDGKLDTVLKDGDIVSLFPPVGGG
ncbi:MoaD/ThiS family protein [Thermohalobacter berrensis]|uniref:Molybdopterin synthase sulfur carrier subunit n=1 Tax=Thermohalobacter berrensis TaxID=99594 RepID=A0A419SU89_9FIRM|nr:MoaD/ThiS family protein [Thermohalobacter berrensis]RKD28810.1 molybdopterin synthase sulfur carrier subunit [Thermohalobacter berrensis]